jgi:hypothetical protein
MSDINWAAIRAEYEAGGVSLRQLAAKYSVSKTYLIERRDKEAWNRPTTDRPPTTIAHESHVNPTPKKDLATKDTQRLFLEAFATHANVMVSARVAGIHRSTVYEWLEHDEDFSFAYNLAKEDAKDTLRAEIYRRAHEGWDEDVYQLSKFAGTVHKYSDTLLIFHAKMLMPEYRDKQSIELSNNGPIRVDYSRYSDAELATLESLARKAVPDGGS